MRRAPIALAAVAGVAVIGTVAFVLVDGDGDGPDALARIGSVAVDADEPLVIEDEPAGYRITYRVAEVTGDVTTDEVTVNRPFGGEVITRRDGEVIDEQRSAFGRLLAGPDDDRRVFALGPSIAAADLRFAPAIDEAIERGWLERREQREVAGRRCQVYRAGTSVLGGALLPPGDPDVEHADVCVDAAGLLLEEWWVVEGAAIRHRVATEVDEDAPARLGSAWEDEPTTFPVDKGGGSILPLVPGSAPPGTFFEAGDVPAGFEHLGRWSVIPPQAGAFTDDAQRGTIIASAADVWRRGIDVLVLDQGGSLEQVQVLEADPDNPIVPIEGLGDAELVVGLGANEVRVIRPSGKFVRAVGTLPLDDLVDFMRALVETEGNELVVDD